MRDTARLQQIKERAERLPLPLIRGDIAWLIGLVEGGEQSSSEMTAPQSSVAQAGEAFYVCPTCFVETDESCRGAHKGVNHPKWPKAVRIERTPVPAASVSDEPPQKASAGDECKHSSVAEIVERLRSERGAASGTHVIVPVALLDDAAAALTAAQQRADEAERGRKGAETNTEVILTEYRLLQADRDVATPEYASVLLDRVAAAEDRARRLEQERDEAKRDLRTQEGITLALVRARDAAEARVTALERLALEIIARAECDIPTILYAGFDSMRHSYAAEAQARMREFRRRVLDGGAEQPDKSTAGSGQRPLVVEAALAFVSSVRDLGRGALKTDATMRDGEPTVIEISTALDIFDRQIDHIEGWMAAHLGVADGLCDCGSGHLRDTCPYAGLEIPDSVRRSAGESE